MLHMWASKPAWPPVIAAKIAFTPPPITMWNLGLSWLQNSGLIATEFIGSSCLKYLRIYNVSGSKIFEPLSAAVAKMLKSLLKAIPLIFVLSWIKALANNLPSLSYRQIYPSSVQINILSLSTYQRALPAACWGLGSYGLIKVLYSIYGLSVYGFISP